MRLKDKIDKIIGIIFGITAIIGIVVFGIYSQLKHYQIHLLCDNAKGLSPGAVASYMGVKIGNVKKVVLEDRQAVVTLDINREVQIPVNSIFNIELAGITGDKRIDVVFSKELEYIKPGAKIAAIDKTKSVEVNLKKLLERGRKLNRANSLKIEKKKREDLIRTEKGLKASEIEHKARMKEHMKN